MKAPTRPAALIRTTRSGETSDNLPGVPGIGLKTAAQLIKEFGDLETLLARAHEIKQPKRRETLIEKRDHFSAMREVTAVPVKISKGYCHAACAGFHQSPCRKKL